MFQIRYCFCANISTVNRFIRYYILPMSSKFHLTDLTLCWSELKVDE
jgi:hypothetical protein